MTTKQPETVCERCLIPIEPVHGIWTHKITQPGPLTFDHWATPRTQPAVPAQSAPTLLKKCQCKCGCQASHYREDKCNLCRNGMHTPIPPTSAPTPEPEADICPSCGRTDKTERAACANAWHDGIDRLRAEIAELKRQLAEEQKALKEIFETMLPVTGTADSSTVGMAKKAVQMVAP